MSSANSLNRIFSTAGRWSLVFAAALFPFELKSPLLNVGPFQITTAEMGLYLVIVVWALSRLVELFRISSPQEGSGSGKFRMSSAHAAVILWAAVVILSALRTQTEHAAALKFALRNLGACALFFAASDLAVDARYAAQVCAALVAG